MSFEDVSAIDSVRVAGDACVVWVATKGHGTASALRGECLSCSHEHIQGDFQINAFVFYTFPPSVPKLRGESGSLWVYVKHFTLPVSSEVALQSPKCKKWFTRNML